MASERAGPSAGARLARAALPLAIAACGLSTFAHSAAHAGPARIAASDRETARNLMDIGREKFAAGEFEAALEAYQAADRLMAVPTTALAVADALTELGRLIEARETLLRVIRHPKQEDEPKPYAAARKRAQELSPALAARIPSLRVEVLAVDSEKPIAGAAVRLDGESIAVEALKLPRKLDPGEHTVAATAPGFETSVKTIELGKSEHHLVSVVLRRSESAGGAASIGDVSPLVWIGYGFTVAGAIAGAATGSAALAKSAALAEDCPNEQCPPASQDTVDSMELLSHMSTISFAVAGAGAVLGTIGVVLSVGGSEPDSELARVTPSVGPGFVGLTGRF